MKNDNYLKCRCVVKQFVVHDTAYGAGHSLSTLKCLDIPNEGALGHI